MKHESALYLFPVNISDLSLSNIIPQENIELLRGIHYFIVENIRTARRFIKKCVPQANISLITFYELNRHTEPSDVSAYLEPLRKGESMGIMSEAGCPGVADPGALPVRIAQEEGLKVVPLVGPSSILLSLMASGLNGQCFMFHGYLPVETENRDRAIRTLENESRMRGVTQIFIETPYRNEKMFESLLKNLRGDTLLCVAEAVTDPEKESIKTRSVARWKSGKAAVSKEPTVFLFYCPNQESLKTLKNHGKKKNFI